MMLMISVKFYKNMSLNHTSKNKILLLEEIRKILFILMIYRFQEIMLRSNGEMENFY